MILYKAKSINIKADRNSGKRLAIGGNNAQKKNSELVYVKIYCFFNIADLIESIVL